MSHTPTLINTGSIFGNANGTITVVLPTAGFLDVAVIVGETTGTGASQLKQLTDVVGADSGANGYILAIDTHGTANTADDTYDFIANNPNLDGGDF